MMKETDNIEVMVADLRLILRALESAQGAQTAWDLLQQFRDMDKTVRRSNLSATLGTAYNRVAGYLTEAEKTIEELPEGDDDSGS